MESDWTVGEEGYDWTTDELVSVWMIGENGVNLTVGGTCHYIFLDFVKSHFWAILQFLFAFSSPVSTQHKTLAETH